MSRVFCPLGILIGRFVPGSQSSVSSQFIFDYLYQSICKSFSSFIVQVNVCFVSPISPLKFEAKSLPKFSVSSQYMIPLLTKASFGELFSLVLSSSGVFVPLDIRFEGWNELDSLAPPFYRLNPFYFE